MGILNGNQMNLKSLFASFIPGLLLVLGVSTLPAQDWLRFRGNDGSGVSSESAATATEFSLTKNIAWKTDLPGAGASAPIIVGDKIFLTCYSGYGMSRTNPGDMANLKRHVVCYNKRTGVKIWQKDIASVLPEDPFSGMGVPEHGYASGSPVSDGKLVFAFLGKSGVFGFDLEGNQIWSKSLGTDSGRMKWGSGASPILHKDVLIINASDESNSLVGLNKSDGETIWKNSEIQNAWSTPLIVGSGEKAVLVFSIPYEVWGLNPKNGKLKWYATNGIPGNSVSTSPIANQDVVIVMGGRSSSAVAIKMGGQADVTQTHTLWEGKATGRIVSPIVIDDYIFGFDRGIANCIKADSGESVFRERLPVDPNANSSSGRRGISSNYCSPVSADGKIYQFTKKGTCYVLQAKPEFKVLATNNLNDGSEFNSTPAISEGKIYVRSNKRLYCISAE